VLLYKFSTFCCLGTSDEQSLPNEKVRPRQASERLRQEAGD